MSTETLRRAAAQMREDWPAQAVRRETRFYNAVAEWLEVVARRWIEAGTRSSITRERASAIAVARAYLGEEPE